MMYKICYILSFLIVSSSILSMDITSHLNNFKTVLDKTSLEETDRSDVIIEMAIHLERVKFKRDWSFEDLSPHAKNTYRAFAKEFDQLNIINKTVAHHFADQAVTLITQNNKKLQKVWNQFC